MPEKVKGILTSRLSHPVTISYDGMSVVVPPKAYGKNAPRIEDASKIGALPSGVTFVRK